MKRTPTRTARMRSASLRSVSMRRAPLRFASKRFALKRFALMRFALERFYAFDVLWRANRRNMRLLREWLERDKERF